MIIVHKLEMMIYLGAIKIQIEAGTFANNIHETLEKELKDRFGVVLTHFIKTTLSGDYYKKGYTEPNPYYISDVRKILNQELDKRYEATKKD